VTVVRFGTATRLIINYHLKKKLDKTVRVKCTLKQFEATDRGSDVRSLCRPGAPMEDGVAHMSGYFSEGRGLFDFGRGIPGSLLQRPV
jgi:hypothetical protein